MYGYMNAHAHTHTYTQLWCSCGTQDNRIENFIVEQFSGLLNQNLLSTNPYPELFVRMSVRQVYA